MPIQVPPLSPPGSPTGTPSFGAWYSARLGSTDLPGRWRVTSGKIVVKYDPRKKSGADGANPVFHGLDPQQFELEGEQSTDDERSALAAIFADIIPPPGQTGTQRPLPLQHPSVAYFGFALNVVVIGASIMEHVGVGRTRVRLTLLNWMPAVPVPTNRPTQSVRSTPGVVGQHRQQQQQQANQPPHQQPNSCAPPASFTPTG